MLQGLTELQKELQQAKAALAASKKKLSYSLSRLWRYIILFCILTFALLRVPALLNETQFRLVAVIEACCLGMIFQKYEEYHAARHESEEARVVVASIEQAIIVEEKRLQDAGSAV